MKTNENPLTGPMNGRSTLIAAGAAVLLAGAAVFAGVKASDGKHGTEAGEATAKIGAPAPDFTLIDLDGRKVRLSKFKGKTVVLEWFNPDCPFVKLAHGRELSLKNKAAAYKKKGVVWLAVNSNGPGKQGHEKAANVAGRDNFGIKYPILLDPTGEVGRQYGAERTPHMFVINKKGVLVYDGAVDNTRGGDPSDAEPPPAQNYIDKVLAAVLAGKKPPVSETVPWGCSVKYAK